MPLLLMVIESPLVVNRIQVMGTSCEPRPSSPSSSVPATGARGGALYTVTLPLPTSRPASMRASASVSSPASSKSARVSWVWAAAGPASESQRASPATRPPSRATSSKARQDNRTQEPGPVTIPASGT